MILSLIVAPEHTCIQAPPPEAAHNLPFTCIYFMKVTEGKVLFDACGVQIAESTSQVLVLLPTILIRAARADS